MIQWCLFIILNKTIIYATIQADIAYNNNFYFILFNHIYFHLLK